MEKSEKYLACLHWLEQIEDKTIREAAISQMDAERIELYNKAESIISAIDCFNDWGKTKENRMFWHRVLVHYEIGVKLPEYPKNILLESRVKELEEALTSIRKILLSPQNHEPDDVLAHILSISSQAIRGGNQ